jgi:hypothetical protein
MMDIVYQGSFIIDSNRGGIKRPLFLVVVIQIPESCPPKENRFYVQQNMGLFAANPKAVFLSFVKSFRAETIVKTIPATEPHATRPSRFESTWSKRKPQNLCKNPHSRSIWLTSLLYSK